MLTENHIKEGLSRAYILAVAHRAGFNVSVRGFDYGIDGAFHGVGSRDGRVVETGFTIEFQAKASENCTVGDTEVVYDLAAKNHRDLTMATGIPRILVVLALPKDKDEWLRTSAESMVLKRCAWWTSLRGQAPTTNEGSQRVRIPAAQRFDGEALLEMMSRVTAGGLP